jgi:hypothetical protein
MRWALAIAVIAVTLAGAVYLHERQVDETYLVERCNPYFSSNCLQIRRIHPSWDDPVAVLLAIGGIAVAVGIALGGRKPDATTSGS